MNSSVSFPLQDQPWSCCHCNISLFYNTHGLLSLTELLHISFPSEGAVKLCESLRSKGIRSVKCKIQTAPVIRALVPSCGVSCRRASSRYVSGVTGAHSPSFLATAGASRTEMLYASSGPALQKNY